MLSLLYPFRLVSSPLSACLVLALALPAPAAVTVNTGSVVRELPEGIGGVNIFAHDNRFATNRDGIPYQSDLGLAGIGLVRTVTYPDPDYPSHALSYFDNNVSKILAQGAKPLFVAYFTPTSLFLNSGGSTGGTLESNIIYLVNRYKAPPYNLQVQYWEMHNEPELPVDYQMTPQAYAAAFNSVHNALVSAGIRNNVILCGPATSNDYGWVEPAVAMMDYFLDHCKHSVDVVTRHIYINDSSEDWLLNNIDRIERQWNHALPVSVHGEALLQQTMNNKGVPSYVMTGITEYGIGTAYPDVWDHSITQGLWSLIALKYASYNPRSLMTAGFIFDSYGAQDGGYGYYNASKQRDPNWWAHYIHGRLRGHTVLAQTSSNSKLVVCATRSDDHLYVEVINRDVAQAITDSVTIQGAPGGNATVFRFSATENTLQTGAASSYGGSFSYTFPSKSVTIFRYSLAGGGSGPLFTIGFEASEGYVNGSPLTNHARWTGMPALLSVGAGGSAGQGLISAPAGPSVTAYSNVNYAPAAADFGGASGPVTPGYTGRVEGSVELAVAGYPAVADSTRSWFVRLGGLNQLEFFILADRSFEIRSTAGNFLARDGSGGVFRLGGSFVGVDYQIDYAAQTARLWVNGVAQATAGGAYDIPWTAAVTGPCFSGIRFQSNVASSSDRYIRLKADTVTFGTGAPALAGFEASQGYAMGQSLASHARWAGSTEILRVATGGNGSAQSALGAAKTGVSLAAYQNASMAALASDFGGSAAPITAGYTGQVAGSVSLAVAEVASTQDAAAAWFVRFGDTGQFEMFVRASGHLEVRTAAGNFLAETAAGAPLVIGSAYVDVDFVINYGSQTTRVWVNGVAQTTSAGSAEIPWLTPASSPRFSYVRFQNNVANNHARYSRLRVDNLTFGLP